MNRKSLKGTIFLLIGSMIWGSAFVAQNVGMDYVGPYTFNGLRFLVGTLTLLPVIIISDLIKKKLPNAPQKTAEELRSERKTTIKAGIIAGFALFIPSTLQQIGLIETSPGKSGFITAMYIVTVPLLALFLGKKAGANVWISVCIAIAGLYLLCVTEQFSINASDTITLISVIFWAVQILVIDRYAAEVDCLKLACLEFLVSGLLSLIPMFLLEQPEWEGIKACAVPLLYTGIMSCGVAYTLQPLGQKYTPPSVAAILMSMESVFAALAGFLILHEKLSPRELAGCALMFCAVLLSQFPFKRTAEKQA